ncbi:NAD(P)/FAD-dependent oxidoreductase [Thalassospiraceae bacterium LMO-JJ14]|nr:NAD(P)/FAD-dependent oxidoreductase [Thalassospiraceae bacterium LMO-JJ14]
MRGVSENFDADVIVAGLGPAGARAAAAAAKEGKRVIALERKRRAGMPVQCAEFIPTMVSQELGELDAVTRQRINAMETFIEGETCERTENFPGRMISREAFDRRLVEDAIHAGSDCRFGVKIAAIAEDGAVHLSDGQTLKAPVLIGGDGPRSCVGAAIGAVNTDMVETRQLTVPLLRAHDATDIFLSEQLPGGYAWLFPRGDVANLGAGVIPCARTVLKDYLNELHEDLVAQGRVGAEVLSYTGGAIPVGGRLFSYAMLGDTAVLLCGDACGLANPVTGGGIASAVISGGLAGEAAVGWLDGDEDSLDDFESELAAIFDPALNRAVRRRCELLGALGSGEATAADFRRGWIAYEEYWNDETTLVRGNAA